MVGGLGNAMAHGYVRHEVHGGRLRAGVWGTGHQRVGCGGLSEHGECDRAQGYCAAIVGTVSGLCCVG